MPFRTLLFITLFVTCAGGALFVPLLGILGYVAHYTVGPERQWWAAPIRNWGIRYSYMLALLTAIGVLLHFRNLQYGRTLIRNQEKLILLFLGVVWLSVMIGEPTVAYAEVDHPSVKMLKIVLFVLMLTHIVTTEKRLNALFWVLTVSTLLLGVQAYNTPKSAFEHGRLETVGGADFLESNFLSAFLAAMLPLIGVQFLRSTWKGKVVCLVAGVFAANAIILTRSRGAVVGIAAGCVVAVLLAPRGRRIVILSCMVVALAGGYYLMDPGFIGRASTIPLSTTEARSAEPGRTETWVASMKLLEDKPLGVGAGNFSQAIGRYDIRQAGRDAHNTVARCYSELGLQGAIAFLAVIGGALWVLRRVAREAEKIPQPDRDRVVYASYGLAVGIVTMLICGLFVTLLYTEVLWWLLALPVCMERVVSNLLPTAGHVPRESGEPAEDQPGDKEGTAHLAVEDTGCVSRDRRHST